MTGQAALKVGGLWRGSVAAVLVATTCWLLERLRMEQERRVSQRAYAHEHYQKKNRRFCEASHRYSIWMHEAI
jgi:hypothetical protein